MLEHPLTNDSSHLNVVVWSATSSYSWSNSCYGVLSSLYWEHTLSGKSKSWPGMYVCMRDPIEKNNRKGLRLQRCTMQKQWTLPNHTLPRKLTCQLLQVASQAPVSLLHWETRKPMCTMQHRPWACTTTIATSMDCCNDQNNTNSCHGSHSLKFHLLGRVNKPFTLP